MNTEIHSHPSYLHTISKSTKQYLSYIIEKYVILSTAICSYLKQIIVRSYSFDHLLSTFSFIVIISLGETFCFSFVIDHNLFYNFKCFHLSVYLFLEPFYVFIHFSSYFIYWCFFFIFILIFYSYILTHAHIYRHLCLLEPIHLTT